MSIEIRWRPSSTPYREETRRAILPDRWEMPAGSGGERFTLQRSMETSGESIPIKGCTVTIR